MAKKRFDPERYLRRYATEFPRLKGLAERLQKFAVSVLADAYLTVHLVSARPKTVESLREKIQRKSYRSPGRQVTDKIGLRIITYYRDDVDRVSEILRSRFAVNLKKSVDKRTALGLTSF